MICEQCGMELGDPYILQECTECEECGHLNQKEGEPLCVCYHGTNEDSAEAILEEGFRVDTWFAKHLEDALGFGGSHLFEVVFARIDVLGAWQFQAAEAIPLSRIVSYRVFSIESRLNNPMMGEEILESNIPPGKRAYARKEFEIETSDMSRMQKVRALRELQRTGV